VAPPPEVSSAPAATTAVQSYVISETGTASFLIDAPLEKIKGRSGKLRGSLQLDPSDIRATRGQIAVDLGDLKTETFNDPSKDAKQTDHTHNWLQLGADVPEKERSENRWVRFTIRSISSASANRIADAPEKEGKRTVSIVAEGDLWLHGVSAAKTVKLTVEFQGPPAAPTSLRVVTAEPFAISLEQHHVKPRDVAGKLLDGALEKVGKKIDDAVQISIELTGAPGKA
jgi:polyisoprenoid-binding protein YceI